jgi:hypothetical protein
MNHHRGRRSLLFPFAAGFPRRTEASMHLITRLVAVLAGLVLLLNVTPSWGQPVCVAPGCNPAVSDDHLNTAGGSFVLSSLAPGGSNNTAFGYAALHENTTGQDNTASGAQALFFNTTGQHNTATGVKALHQNTTGQDNTASGVNALFSNTTGTFNTASGSGALSVNDTGGGNTATGGNALLS